MYGGDEVSAIVVDIGSHTCKAGYAGEDVPKAVFPSVFGEIGAPPETAADGVRPPRKLFVGNTAVGFRRDGMELKNVMANGVVQDWEAMEAVLDHAFKDRLLIDPREHPMLLAEPSFNPTAVREKSVEMMFEKYGVPALFLAKNAVLTSFASGRATSVVIDSGGSSTNVTAVNDGYVLQKILPRYSFKKKEVRPGEFEILPSDFPQTTDSYQKWARKEIVCDMKEAVCRVAEAPYQESAYERIPTTPYELPDGQVIEVGGDRFKVAEVLFNPQLVKAVECINRCDADIRKELYGAVLWAAGIHFLLQKLAGGNAALQQIKERLEKEVTEIAPPVARLKVLASGNSSERRFSVWIGGSILASLGTFQQMWLSKQEYEEHGASYVHRKCQ